MGLLQKIEWKTRMWNIKFNLLDIYLHDGDGCWGFTLFEIVNKFTPYSLLSIEFRLPNGGNRKSFKITNWDFLFLGTPLWKYIDSTSENILWGSAEPTGIRGLLYRIAKKLYK